MTSSCVLLAVWEIPDIFSDLYCDPPQLSVHWTP